MSVQTVVVDEKQVSRVPKAMLCRRLGLPADTSEAAIYAALAAPPTAKPARRPVLPRVSARSSEQQLRASVRSLSVDELRTRVSGAASSVERAIAEEELSHRLFLSGRFPAQARAAGYEPFEPDLTARDGGSGIGPSRDYSGG